MNCNLVSLLAGLVLLSAVPANAQLLNHTELELDIVGWDGGVYALVTVQHQTMATLDVDVVFLVNGNVVKTDPLYAPGTSYLSERVTDGSSPAGICVLVDGKVVYYGDTTNNTAAQTCGSWSPTLMSASGRLRSFVGGNLSLPAPIDAGPVREAKDILAGPGSTGSTRR
jgi:hypothetical protein